MSFLSLPPEIRYMIYRELRTFQSPILPPRQHREVREMGYCSYGFHWSVLATNRLILFEALQVFYGENDWTFFVNLAIPFDHCSFMLSPLAANLSLMRRIHIRFHMFDWMFIHTSKPCLPVEALRDILSQICKILGQIHHLQSIKLIWTETSLVEVGTLMNSPWQWITPTGSAATTLQTLIYSALQPLVEFPYLCPLQRSTVLVRFRAEERVRAAEVAFATAVDTLIKFRNSSAFPKSQRNPPLSNQTPLGSDWLNNYRNSDLTRPNRSWQHDMPLIVPPGFQKRRCHLSYNGFSGVLFSYIPNLKGHSVVFRDD